MNHPTPAGAKGFTLIELMITVAIVAILATIAYPSYREHVVKTQRGAAKACLSQYAQFMERLYTTSLTYDGAAIADLGCATEGQLNRNYTFSIVNRGASTYTVVATPTTAFAGRDTRCGTLSINQAGQRTAGSGSDDDVRVCW